MYVHVSYNWTSHKIDISLLIICSLMLINITIKFDKIQNFTFEIEIFLEIIIY